MRKIVSYLFTKEELTEIIQNILDDSSLRLIKQPGGYYYVCTEDMIILDACELDVRIAEYLKIPKCEHCIISGKNRKQYVVVIDTEFTEE